MDYNFEWNIGKARENQQKHGVAFDEAATVFRDANALSIFDTDHSDSEERWINDTDHRTYACSAALKSFITCSAVCRPPIITGVYPPPWDQALDR